MNNKRLDSDLAEDAIWPPPPSVPPPATTPQEPLLMHLSLEMLILVDLGMSLAVSGTHCLVRLASHKPIDWRDTAIGAVIYALTFFVLHLFIRSCFKKHWETTAQENGKTQ